MDIRDHGGPFGGGKYRKGKIINTETDLQLITTIGDIFKSVVIKPALVPTAHQVWNMVKVGDGYIYIISYMASSPYTVHITKVDDEFNVITPTMILPNANGNYGLIMMKTDGYYLYLASGDGSITAYDVRDLSAYVWRWFSGSVSYDPTDIKIKGNYIYAGVSGNLATVSLVVLNKLTGAIILQKDGLNTDNKSIAVDNDGFIYLGAGNSTNPGTRSVLFKLDAAGNIIWEHKIASYLSSPPRRLFVDPKTNKLHGLFGSSFYKVNEINKADGTLIQSSAYNLYAPVYGDATFDKYGHILVVGKTTSSGVVDTIARIRASDLLLKNEVKLYEADAVRDFILDEDKETIYGLMTSNATKVRALTTYQLA